MKTRRKETRKKNNKSRKNKSYLIKKDFYNYVNSDWIKKTKIKKNEMKKTEFSIGDDKIKKKLKDLITNDKYLNIFYEKFKGFDNDGAKMLLEKHIKQYNTFVENDDLWGFICYLNKSNITTPFNISVSSDIKLGVYCIYLSHGGIELPDRDYYINKSYNIYLEKYKVYLNELMDEVFQKMHKCKCEDIVYVEKLIAKLMTSRSDTQDSDYYYNKESINNLQSKYNINWKNISDILNIKDVKEVIITNTTYMKEITKLLMNNWNSDKWKSYWIHIFVNDVIHYNEIWNKKSFEFFDKYLMGIQSPSSREDIALEYIKNIFNTRLNKIYVSKYHNQKIVNYVRNLYNELKEIFYSRLLNNCWLSSNDKKDALNKLSHMEIIVGTTNKYIEDPKIDSKLNIIDIVDSFQKWSYKYQIRLINKKVNPHIWDRNDSNIFDVNAYYYPNYNKVIIPYGYIEKPFVDINKGLEYNLAWIGSTIAHEITHGFDNEGSKFNSIGLLTKSWTPETITKYQKLQKDILKQYNMLVNNDNHNIDAQLSLGENIADIGGLLITEEMLLTYMLKNNIRGKRKIKILESFYINYAKSWRSKVGKKAKKYQLLTNEHLSAKYRVNGSLMRSDLFLNTFKIKQKDKMYYENKENIW